MATLSKRGIIDTKRRGLGVRGECPYFFGAKSCRCLMGALTTTETPRARTSALNPTCARYVSLSFLPVHGARGPTRTREPPHPFRARVRVTSQHARI